MSSTGSLWPVFWQNLLRFEATFTLPSSSDSGWGVGETWNEIDRLVVTRRRDGFTLVSDEYENSKRGKDARKPVEIAVKASAQTQHRR
jgi:hypothetical protein